MCGIVGVYKLNKSFEITKNILGNLKHRGRDLEGIFSENENAIGMCQLKLLESQNDSLPIHFDKSFYVAFNGEIYSWLNEKEKTELKPKNIEQEIQGLMLLYNGCGVEINGMYAIAIYSEIDKKVTLIRDPFGIKPLYWKKINDGIVYSSELNSIKKIQGTTSNFNIDSLLDILFFGTVLESENTIYNDIYQVKKGSSITFDNNNIIKSELKLNSNICEEFNLNSLDNRIKESVKNCLSSKRKIGLAISGGIDSSLIAYYINELGYENLTTISIKIEGSEDYLENLDYLKLKNGNSWKNWKHIVVDFTKEEFLRYLNESSRIMGEPFQMTSVPLYLKIAEVAAENDVKILITGEGADELFFGYNSYRNIKTDSLLPVSDQINNFYFSNEKNELLVDLFGSNKFEQQKNKFKTKIKELENKDVINVLKKLEKEFSLEPLLKRIDRCLMNFNIEGRVPFLHSGISEISDRINKENLFDEKQTKKQLIALYKMKYGNVELINKTAFRIPIEDWIPSDFIDEMTNDYSKYPILNELISEEKWKYLISLVNKKQNKSAINIFYNLFTLIGSTAS